MANKNEDNRCVWIKLDDNSHVELKEKFDEEEFDKLIENSAENESKLMCTWFENPSDVEHTMLYGSALIDHFQQSIKNDKKSLTAFKLGELYGHIMCLDVIKDDDAKNRLTKDKFESAKSCLPDDSHQYVNDVLIAVYNNFGIKKKDLLRKIPISLIQLQGILDVLEYEGFIQCKKILGDDFEFRYSLKDLGIRLITRRIMKRSESG